MLSRCSSVQGQAPEKACADLSKTTGAEGLWV